MDNSTVKDTFNLLSSDTCSAIDVAFIAVDEHGASTDEFMHFLGVESQGRLDTSQIGRAHV